MYMFDVLLFKEALGYISLASANAESCMEGSVKNPIHKSIKVAHKRNIKGRLFLSVNSFIRVR